jgi:hypothetical protein
MYRVQQRYWADHPPVQWMVQAYLKIPFKKTPPPQASSAEVALPMRPVDWSVLDD